MDESIYTASSSWLYRQHPICLVAVLMVVMTLTAEIGFRLGRRWHPRTDDARRSHLASVMGSLLGLLALLLSFTFAMSANRYDTRRQMVMSEASTWRSAPRPLFCAMTLPQRKRRKPSPRPRACKIRC
jgi:hypothetical protein